MNNVGNLFSVVIPLYNKEYEIERAISSILNQTYRGFEIIVVNDGSTDGGPERVTRYGDNRIRLISQKNMGVSAARNRGISESNNELVSFLDADDEWTPDYLETIVRLRQRYPVAGIYATAYEVIAPDGNLKKINYRGINLPDFEGLLENYFRQALGSQPVCSSATTVPKTVISRIGLFALNENMGEDLDMWGRIAIHYPVAFSKKRCAVYYQDAGNRATSGCNRRCERESPFVKTARMLEARGEIPKKIIKDVRNYAAHLQLNIAYLTLMDGQSPIVARRLLFLIRPSLWRLRVRKALLSMATFFPQTLLRKIRGISKQLQR